MSEQPRRYPGELGELQAALAAAAQQEHDVYREQLGALYGKYVQEEDELRGELATRIAARHEAVHQQFAARAEEERRRQGAVFDRAKRQMEHDAEAGLRIYGRYEYTNPVTGETITSVSDTKSKLDSMREDPNCGETEQARNAVSNDYAAAIDHWRSKNYSLAQAELIVEARIADRKDMDNRREELIKDILGGKKNLSDAEIIGSMKEALRAVRHEYKHKRWARQDAIAEEGIYTAKQYEEYVSRSKRKGEPFKEPVPSEAPAPEPTPVPTPKPAPPPEQKSAPAPEQKQPPPKLPEPVIALKPAPAPTPAAERGNKLAEYTIPREDIRDIFAGLFQHESPKEHERLTKLHARFIELVAERNAAIPRKAWSKAQELDYLKDIDSLDQAGLDVPENEHVKYGTVQHHLLSIDGDLATVEGLRDIEGRKVEAAQLALNEDGAELIGIATQYRMDLRNHGGKLSRSLKRKYREDIAPLRSKLNERPALPVHMEDTTEGKLVPKDDERIPQGEFIIKQFGLEDVAGKRSEDGQSRRSRYIAWLVKQFLALAGEEKQAPQHTERVDVRMGNVALTPTTTSPVAGRRGPTEAPETAERNTGRDSRPRVETIWTRKTEDIPLGRRPGTRKAA